MRRPSRQGQSAVPSSRFTVAIAAKSFLLLLCLLTGRAYTQDLNDAVNAYFDAMRHGGQPSFREVSANATAEDFAVFYKALEPRLRDSSIAVSRKACELVQFLASQARDERVRSEGVTLLVNVSGKESFEVRLLALDLLTQFRRADFSETAKDTLRKLVRSKTTPADRFFRLAGFVGLRDLIPDIRPYAQPGNPASLRWTSLIALARLGDGVALNEVMQRVKKFPVDDDVVYKLFPDLRYTRQAEAVAYMVEALQSNGRHCQAADVERPRAIPCGYRIMEQLAPVIKDFPVTLDESGDLATDDYPGALERVRAWFAANKTYTLCNDTY